MAVYAAYHRHPVNKAIHYLFVPMIVWSIMGLLGFWTIGTTSGIAVTPAIVASVAVLIYYLALDFGFGVASVLLFTFLLGTTLQIHAAVPEAAIWIFLGAFALGWAGQLVGHAAFERRRPALADNLFQVLVAPIFVVAEWAFALGLRRDVQRAVEERLATTGKAP